MEDGVVLGENGYGNLTLATAPKNTFNTEFWTRFLEKPFKLHETWLSYVFWGKDFKFLSFESKFC